MSCKDPKDSLKCGQTTSPRCTPQLTRRWSTHTCLKTTHSSASTESLAPTNLHRTQKNHGFPTEVVLTTWRSGSIGLFRLRHFLTGLRASSWWTMRFTKLEMKVRRGILWFWDRDWSQREGTEEKIGFSFVFDSHSLASVRWSAEQQALFSVARSTHKKKTPFLMFCF